MQPQPSTTSPLDFRPRGGRPRKRTVLLALLAVYLFTPGRQLIGAGWDAATSTWFWTAAAWALVAYLAFVLVAYLAFVAVRWLYRGALVVGVAGQRARRAHTAAKQRRTTRHEELAPAHAAAPGLVAEAQFDGTLDDIRNLPETE